jgi:predicted RNA binding protein YcfA (HicA-like mRNA interferase family)
VEDPLAGIVEKRPCEAPAVKVRDVIKKVKKDGWFDVNQEGSHRQYKHPSKKGRVTIAGHPSADLPPKTLKSILGQAGLK